MGDLATLPTFAPSPASYTHADFNTAFANLTIANAAVTTNKIADAAVTLAKITTIAAATILGNNTGSAAAPIALTATQARGVLGLATTDNVTLGTLTVGTIASSARHTFTGTGLMLHFSNTSPTTGPYARWDCNNVGVGIIGTAENTVSGAASTEFGLDATSKFRFSINGASKALWDANGIALTGDYSGTASYTSTGGNVVGNGFRLIQPSTDNLISLVRNDALVGGGSALLSAYGSVAIVAGATTTATSGTLVGTFSTAGLAVAGTLTSSSTYTQNVSNGVESSLNINQSGNVQWSLRNIATTGAFYISSGGSDWMTIAKTTGATVFNGVVTMNGGFASVGANNTIYPASGNASLAMKGATTADRTLVQFSDQAGVRKMEIGYWNSTATTAYGWSAGEGGINSVTATNLSINDVLVTRVSSSGVAVTGALSATGNIKLANAFFLTGRNFANSADVSIVKVNTSDAIEFGTGGYTSVFIGPVIAPAATTSIPSIRMPHGAAPTTPTNGDFWTTTAGLFGRINGVTVSYGAGGGGTVTAIGVTTANGVSGSSSGGTTPNLTITLGAITPSSVQTTGNILIGTATDGMTAGGSLAITQDLAHRGSKVGFYNTTPIVKPTVSGSKASNAALAALCGALSSLGLITDTTT